MIKPDSANLSYKKPKVVVIVLNWNGYSDTVECVHSLLKMDYTNFDILIVDNGSSDGSVKKLKSEFPELTVIENKENLGYSGGNNVGIKYALEKGADYAFLLNNDTVVDSQVLTKLVAVAEEDKAIGMVGPIIYDYYHPTKIWFAGSNIDFRTGLTPHWGEGEEVRPDWIHNREPDRLTGCAILVKRGVILSVGMLDDDYFLYYEDTDWCVRAKRHGFVIKCAVSAKVWHKQTGSERRMNGSPVVWYYCQRNKLLFLKKNSGISISVHLHNWFIIGVYMVSLFGYFLGWNPQKLVIKRARYQGIMDFYLGRFGRKEGLVQVKD